MCNGYACVTTGLNTTDIRYSTMLSLLSLVDTLAVWLFAIVGGLLALMLLTFLAGYAWRLIRQTWHELWRPRQVIKASKKQSMIYLAPDGQPMLAGIKLIKGDELEMRAPLSGHGAVWIVVRIEWRKDKFGDGAPSWRLIGGDKWSNIPAVGQLARWPVVPDPKVIAEWKTELRHCKHYCWQERIHCDHCKTHWLKHRLELAGNTPEDVRKLL